MSSNQATNSDNTPPDSTTLVSEDAERVIEISNVWKIFGDRAADALHAIKNEGLGKAEVLESFNAVVGVADVSLEIKRGEIFCIMGLSGSGKSTLVRHFNRLLEPTAGQILIEGTDVMALKTRALQTFRNRKIGMVFSKFCLTATPFCFRQCGDAP